MLASVLEGIVVGLSIAAPFGPVSLVCVQRTILAGRLLGFSSGVGAATAHAVFASLAIVGAEQAAASIDMWRTPIRLASAAVLVLLGMRSVLRSAATPVAATQGRAHGAYLSALLLALSNPMTILPYLAVASAMAVRGRGALWIVPGAALGAAAWYGTLSLGVAMLHHRVVGAILPRLNIASGLVLIGFGLRVGLA